MSAQPEAAFDASIYDLPIPTIDGLKADKLAIIITGRIDLDRTSVDDLEQINNLQLGRPLTLTCQATCVGKPTTYKPDQDGPGTVNYQAVLRITEATITT